MLDTPTDHIVPIDGHPGYYIHPAGQQVYRKGKSGRLRPLKATTDTKGYLHVQLWRSGRMVCARLHRLIYQAVHGSIPDGLMVLHRDDNRLNNSPDNLYSGTAKDNRRDAIRNGKVKTKLNPDRVVMIHFFAAHGFTQETIGRIAGVSKSTAGKVLRGESWSHVSATWLDPERN